MASNKVVSLTRRITKGFGKSIDIVKYEEIACENNNTNNPRCWRGKYVLMG